MFYSFYSFFFLRKISPELTAASPPLFLLRKPGPANIRAHLPLLSMWDAYHSMAGQVVPCPHWGSEPANPGLPRSGMCALNHCATGSALVFPLVISCLPVPFSRFLT